LKAGRLETRYRLQVERVKNEFWKRDSTVIEKLVGQKKRYMDRAAKVFLLSVLLGPLFGGLVLYMWIAITITFGNSPLSTAPGVLIGNYFTVSNVSTYLVSLLFIPIGGYILFGAPAVLSGGWIAFQTWRKGTFGVLESMIGSSTAIAAHCIYQLWPLAESLRQNRFEGICLQFFSGIFAGYACHYLFIRWRIIKGTSGKSNDAN
jgi:hypothetical protein